MVFYPEVFCHGFFLSYFCVLFKVPQNEGKSNNRAMLVYLKDPV